MEYRFLQYKVNYQKKEYVIFIPEHYQQLWIVDWADDWYGGCFIDGSAQCLLHLIAGYGLLAYEPNAILYLPVKHQKIPQYLNHEDNGCYDMVFCTNRCQLKFSEWKAIRRTLKYNATSMYAFDMDTKKIKNQFQKELRKNGMNDRKWLKKAGANIALHASTAFFVFPKDYYCENAIRLYGCFEEVINQNEFGSCYNEEKDIWTCLNCDAFVYGGVKRLKPTYERPYITFYLELCDIDIINRYMKKKVELVNNHHQSVSYAREGYRTLTISIKKAKKTKKAIVESTISS